MPPPNSLCHSDISATPHLRPNDKLTCRGGWRAVEPREAVMPPRSGAALCSARSNESRPIRSRSVTHLQVQLLAAVVAAVVKQRGPPIGQNVDELPPQVVALARIPCGLRNVFDPLDRLRREPPAPDGPVLVAPGKAAQTRRRLLGPNRFLPRVRRGGRGVDHGDPAVR